MRDPISLLSSGAWQRLWFGSLGGTLVLTVALGLLNAPLLDAGHGIVAFELAGSLAAAREILDSWDATARIYAGLSLGLDYLYMPVYSTAIACWCSYVSRKRNETWRQAGLWMVWAQWAAAGFDAVENFALIQELLGSTSRAWPPLAAMCATMKFAIVALGLTYGVTGMVVRRMGSRRVTG